jgi:hypothetical protein
MIMTEQIFVHRNNERIELQGAELEAFIADRELMQAEADARQVEQDAKAAAKESAKAKLAALGLSEVEILALVGE